MAELVLEAERIGASAVCRRESIAPAQLSRWKQKFLQGDIASLKVIKRGPQQKEDPATTELKAEKEILEQALLVQSLGGSAGDDVIQNAVMRNFAIGEKVFCFQTEDVALTKAGHHAD